MNIASILNAPFLLVQIGDYGGQIYEDWPLPKALAPLAEHREKGGELVYPKSDRLQQLVIVKD